jgi:hypothetical protein
LEADLLDRILQEIRERKPASRAAFEESQRLQRALAALEPGSGESPGTPTSQTWWWWWCDCSPPAARITWAGAATSVMQPSSSPGLSVRAEGGSSIRGGASAVARSTLSVLAAEGCKGRAGRFDRQRMQAFADRLG